jgi:hypothetical protein
VFLANSDPPGDHRVVNVADDDTIDIRVFEKTLEIALPHAAGANQPDTHFLDPRYWRRCRRAQ